MVTKKCPWERFYLNCDLTAEKKRMVQRKLVLGCSRKPIISMLEINGEAPVPGGLCVSRQSGVRAHFYQETAARPERLEGQG